MAYNIELGNPVNMAIRDSRIAMQNPYAFLNSDGLYDATAICLTNSDSSITAEIGVKKSSYTAAEVEDKVKAILAALWKENKKANPNWRDMDPIGLLNPKQVIEKLGYSVFEQDALGETFQDGRQVKVAGYINTDDKVVYCSTEIPVDRRLFTIAHELGHMVLHDGISFHREIATDGVLQRDGHEWEADKFATYFLMPSKLVRTRFREKFGADKISLNSESLFYLGISLKQRHEFKSRRQFSRLVASAEFFGSEISLAKQFRVSVESMAIRLEELNLIDFN